MAVIKHADTSVIRSEAPLTPDTRAGELLHDDFRLWFKVGRYRLGISLAEYREMVKHATLMETMHDVGKPN